MSLLLDAGALIAVDRRDRGVTAMLRVAQLERLPVRSSAAVVAQVWRDGARQAALARVLTGVQVVELSATHARAVGELLGRSDTSDVVDAHVVVLAADGDRVVTSDPGHLARLLTDRAVRASVVALR